MSNDYEKGVKVQSWDSEVDFVYFHYKIKTWDLVISINSGQKFVRRTKKYRVVDGSRYNEAKTVNAIRANWVHYVDGLLVRDINRYLGEPLISIHDCFLVDMLRVSDFIFCVNVCMNKPVFEGYGWNQGSYGKFKSFFIFI
jgi:hypothetical protein